MRSATTRSLKAPAKERKEKCKENRDVDVGARGCLAAYTHSP